MHNEKVFVEPYSFNPDRFLTGDNLNEINSHYEVSWGFGRRCVGINVLRTIQLGGTPWSKPNISVCPGRYFAADTLWITLAHILAVYDLKKAKDSDGNVIEPILKLADFGVAT